MIIEFLRRVTIIDTNPNEDIKNFNDIIANCLYCNKKIIRGKDIGKTICLNCMSYIVRNIDIIPERDYQKFIDFAYELKNKLIRGDNLRDIADNIPDGFDEWLVNNVKKTGFGVINTQK